MEFIIECLKKLFTSVTFGTVISGVLVYILSQLFHEIIITPYKKYKKIKSKIAYILVFYKNYYGNPYNITDESNDKEYRRKYDDSSMEIRKVAAELLAFINEFDLKFIIPNKNDLIEAVDSLIGISNGLVVSSEGQKIAENNFRKEEIIVRKLKLKFKSTI